MPKKNRCTVIHHNKQCKNYIFKQNMCYIHLQKHVCCYCGSECNPASQCCGSCARSFISW